MRIEFAWPIRCWRKKLYKPVLLEKDIVGNYLLNIKDIA